MKKIISTFLISFLISCSTDTSKTFKIDYEKFQLDNGLSVILHQDDSDPLVAMATVVHVGSNREKPGRTGFAHFFEHLLGKETKNMASGEWYKILSSNGGNGNAMTSVDMTYYYAVMPSNSLRLGLWRYSEIMLSPVTVSYTHRTLPTTVYE